MQPFLCWGDTLFPFRATATVLFYSCIQLSIINRRSIPIPNCLVPHPPQKEPFIGPFHRPLSYLRHYRSMYVNGFLKPISDWLMVFQHAATTLSSINVWQKRSLSPADWSFFEFHRLVILSHWLRDCISLLLPFVLLPYLNRARKKSLYVVWWILFQLLLTSSASTCLQHSPDHVQRLVMDSEHSWAGREFATRCQKLSGCGIQAS